MVSMAEQLKAAQLEQMIRDLCAQVTPGAQQFLTLQSLYTYRSVSDAELQECPAFCTIGHQRLAHHTPGTVFYPA